MTGAEPTVISSRKQLYWYRRGERRARGLVFADLSLRKGDEKGGLFSNAKNVEFCSVYFPKEGPARVKFLDTLSRSATEKLTLHNSKHGRYPLYRLVHNSPISQSLTELSLSYQRLLGRQLVFIGVGLETNAKLRRLTLQRCHLNHPLKLCLLFCRSSNLAVLTLLEQSLCSVETFLLAQQMRARNGDAPSLRSLTSLSFCYSSIHDQHSEYRVAAQSLLFSAVVNSATLTTCVVHRSVWGVWGDGQLAEAYITAVLDKF